MPETQPIELWQRFEQLEACEALCGTELRGRARQDVAFLWPLSARAAHRALPALEGGPAPPLRGGAGGSCD